MFSISFVDAAGNLVEAGSEIRLPDATGLDLRLISAASDFAGAAEVLIEVIDESDGVAATATADYAPVLTIDTLDLGALSGAYTLRLSVLDSSGTPFGAPQESGLAFGVAPAPYTVQRLEAEEATLDNNGAGTLPSDPVAKRADDADIGSDLANAQAASGDGYVDFAGGSIGSGEYVEFSFDVPAAGDYDLAIGYALGSGSANRPMRLDVNGDLVDRIFDLKTTSSTTSFNEYGEAVIRVTLVAGANTVRLSSNGFSGPNIDYLDVKPADPNVFVFQAENLATGGNKAIDATTLTDGSDTYRVGAEDGSYLDWAGANESATFSFDAPGAGTYDVRVTYAAASDRPLDLELVNGTVSNLAIFAMTKTVGISAYPDDLEDLDPALLPKINSNNLASGWEGWTVETQTITLTEGGSTTLRLASNGRPTGPNIDKIEVALVSLDAVAPSAVSLAGDGVAENDAGAVIGRLDIADADGGTYTFDVLESGVESTRFEVTSAGVLKLIDGVELDFETTGAIIPLTLRVTDENSNIVDTPVTIVVGDIDEAAPDLAPTLSITATPVAENVAGAAVATLTLTDEAPETVTFVLSDARFEIVGGNIVLKSGESLDHETEDGATVTVTATDFGGQSVSADLELSITDVNEAPTLAGTVAAATVPATGGIVSLGSLTAADPDDGDVPSLELATPQEGFEIDADGNLAVAGTVAAGSYQIDLVASDGLLESAPVTVFVSVEAAPVIEFQTIVIQGEDLTSVNSGGDNLIRTQDANQEQPGINSDGSPNTPTGTNNTGLPNFDIYGLRPDYTGDGYFDINGTAGVKATVFIPDLPIEAGTYDFYIRLSNGSAGTAAGNLRAITLDVDGASAEIENTQTGQFYLWGVQKVTLDLPEVAEGPRELTISTSASNGPNIDAHCDRRDRDALQLPAAGDHQPGDPVRRGEHSRGRHRDRPRPRPACQTNGAVGLSDETLSFSIVDGADSALFEIDPATGVLSFLVAPDFESDPISYTLTVEVTDGALTETQEITVNVLDDPNDELATPVIDPIILQAEDATIASGNDDVTGDDCTHTGCLSGKRRGWQGQLRPLAGLRRDRLRRFQLIDGGGIAGEQAITLDLTVTEAGLYDLHVRFMSATGNRPLDIGVNGEIQVAAAEFIGTGFAANAWSVREPITLELEAGANTITLAIPTGTNNGPNIDALALTSVGAPAPAFPAANTAPAFDGAPASVTVDEGTSDVATFGITDDGQGAVEFSLSGNDAALFEIDADGNLSFVTAPDVSADTIYNVDVTVADEAGATTTSVAVTVTNTVDPSVTLTAIPVAENTPGADVASVVVLDPDTIFTAADLVVSDARFTVEAGAGDNNFVLRLVEGAGLDFEGDLPEVIVTAGSTVSAPFTPAVTDVDEPATAITLTPISVAENTAGAVVADIAVADPDAGSSYAAGDLALAGADAGLFEIAGAPGALQLKLKDGIALDFEAADTVVEVTLAGGGLSSGEFSPDVTDVVEAGPVSVVFDAATITGYSTQDKPGFAGITSGGVSVSQDGGSLTLDGNLWKRAPLPDSYTITSETKLTLTVAISAVPAPEIVAIGFDSNESPFDGSSSGTIYQIGGTQRQGAFIELRGTDAVADNGDGTLTVVIDLSQHAGKSIDSLVFIADDDVATNGLGNATFSGVMLSDEDDGNSAPTVVGGGIADLVVNEGSNVEIDLAFVDPDGDVLSYDVTVNDGTSDVTGQFPGIDVVGGVLSGSLGDAAPGVYTVTVTASDPDQATASDSFTLTVLDVNEAPVVGDPAFEPIFEAVGSPITPIDIAQFTGVFSDPDGDSLEFTVPDLPAGLTLDNDGLITGTPTETGDGTFTLVATDPGGLSASVQIELIISAPEVGDVTIVEAEDFTGLAVANNFIATGQVGASGNEIIRANGSAAASSITTDLSQNGLVEGFYTVAMTRYDETDGSATYSLSIGDIVLAENAAFDAAGTFDNTNPRGSAGQPGNLKTVVFDTPVFVTAGTILTLSGQANSELLRTDKFTFTRIESPNTAPSAIALEGGPVAENESGAVLGLLSATDAEGDAITFSVDPELDFEIADGTELRLKQSSAFDFEAGATAQILVTATDARGASSSGFVTVTVTDIDEAPDAPVLDSATIEENVAGAVVGTLSSADPEGATVTFSADPASDFEVVAGQLRLKAGVSLDHESAENVTVRVTATDGVNQAVSDIQVSVIDLNEAPDLADGAALAPVSVAGGVGATVDLTDLGATDPDDGDTATYGLSEASIADGFTIVGSDLIVPATLAEGDYTVEIFATDGALDSDSVFLTVSVGEPAAFTPIVIEAEDEVLAALTVVDTDANANDTTIRDATNPESNPALTNGLRPDFSGTGYLDFGDTPGDAVTFTVTVPAAGDYDLNIRYASQGASRPLDLSVNSAGIGSLDFVSTDPDGTGGIEGFDNWLFLTQTVTLTAGTNTISLTIPTGAVSGPNIDRIEITAAGTGPIGEGDVSADEDGDLAAAPVEASVAEDDLGAVAFDLSGIDDDIVTVEASINGGAFVDVTPAAVTSDLTITLDLSAFAADDSVDVAFRVTDDTANTASVSASIEIENAPVMAFSQTIQLESRAPGIVQIFDTTTTGNNGADATQPRDALNPESVTADRPNGLWTGFNGDGYLDMGQNEGDAFAFEIDAPEAGVYTVTFRYGNGGTTDRPLDLIVGGETVRIPFASTTTWNNWTEVSVDVDLSEGINTLRVEIPSDVSPFTGPNLDQVTVSRDGDTVDPGVEPGPRETIRINFQDGATPKVDGYLVDNFEGFGERGNGQTYGWVTEASATDGDETDAVAIDGAVYPAIAINERTGGVFDSYDPRLTGYAHFDLGGYPARTAWQIELENGFYEVTVSVGDTGGPNDSDNRLFIEGALTTAWTSTDGFKSQLVTATVEVSDGVLTLSAPGGNITEMQYLEIRNLPDLTPDDGNPAPEDYAAFVDPRAISGVGATAQTVSLAPGDGVRPEGIDPSADIVLGLDVVDGRGGVLLESLQDGSIRLFETLTGTEVAYSANTTAGFDSVTISPVGGLKENTSYTLLIDGAVDQGPAASDANREFQKFSTSFTTGEAAEIVDRAVAFVDTVELNGSADGAFGFTSVEMSPDKSQLYVTTILGQIKRWDVNPDGSLDLDSEETFIPGGSFTSEGRGFIGIVFDPEDANTIWVTDNAEIPLTGRDNAVPDFSGRISKVELGTGGSLADATMSTYITGLPRSNGDHVTNSLEFRANPASGQAGEPDFLLYLIQGSNSAMGEADSAWGLRPERLLTAAVMEIDHTRTAPEGGFDVSTEPLPDDNLNRRFADNDGDLKNGGILIANAQDASLNGKFLHFDDNGVATVREGSDASSEVFREYYNPFADDAVLKLFATGQRNAYDLVWHSNGFLYVPTNGSAGGGISPDDPDTSQNEEFSHPTQNDYLFRVVEGGYYGHPNPVRDEFILNGGNPTGAADPNQANGYPVGINPDPNYDLEGAYSLGTNRSPNGATEYLSSVFGNSLQNALLFTQYSSGNDVRVVLLDADGTPTEDFVLQRPDGSTINNYPDPLDIIEGADGRLYVLTLNRSNGQSQLVRLEPAPGGVIGDNTADEGNDLALLVIDGSDPANVVFQVVGLDDDIQTLSVSFDGGTTQSMVTLDGQNRFTADLTGETGPVTATLTVNDDDGNSASDDVTFTPGVTPGPQGFYDGDDFVNLDPGSTIIRTLEDPTTLEFGNNDLDGDGLNDGADGDSYVDFGGGAGDKASLDITVAQAGIYDLVLRMANGSATQARPIDVKLGDQVVSIANTQTGSFTNWVDFTIQLTLEAGVNTVVFAQVAGNGGPNIDSVAVTLDTPIGVPNDGTEVVDGVTFVRYEAENALLDDPTIVDEDRNQSGDFVDYVGPDTETVTWTVFATEAGNYQIDVIYALASDKGARPLALAVNGQGQGTLPFPGLSNSTETNWFPQSAVVTLQAGANTIALTAPGGVGPNLDYLRISQEPVDTFEPDYFPVDADGERIELEQTVDNSTRIVDDSTVEFYFTVAEDGVYALDLAANSGAPDGQGLTLLLGANGGQPAEIEDGGFPGTGDSGEVTAFVELSAGIAYRLVAISDMPGASALDYLDVRPAPGDENADIAVQSQDPTFFDNRLHFSWIDNPAEADGSGNPRNFKEDGTVTISNIGTSPLEILDFEIDGPFVLPEATADSLQGLVLAPGSSIDVDVLFDRAAYTPPPGSGNTLDGAQGVVPGTLTIRTNDSDSPVATVDLAAFWQPIPEGGWEPNVNEVWELFGFGNEIAGLTKQNGGENSVLNFFDVYLPYDLNDPTEILSPYWRIADGETSATITQIAAYHGPGGASINIHNPGNKGATALNNSHGGDENQSILPAKNNGTFNSFTFTNDSIPDSWAGNELFGINVAGLSTDPTLNPTGAGAPSQAQLDARYPGYTVSNGQVFDPEGNPVSDGYTVRMFQALDAEGQIIENVFLGVMDYTGINYDYNDNMFVIEGVTPVFAGAVATISGLDDAAADDRLVFSNAGSNAGVRDTATFTIANDGIGALSIDSIEVDGPFTVTGLSVGQTIASGASVAVSVSFVGTDTVDDNAAVLFEGSLDIGTSAGARTIALAGLAQIQSEGGEEPTVAQIVQAFGYGTDVMQGALSNNATVETVGDEVLLPYLERVDGTKPVEVIQLAAYLSLGDIGRLNSHGLATDDLTPLYSQAGSWAQSVLPEGLGGTESRASFEPDGAFGLKVTVDGKPSFAAWTDPEANLEDPAFGTLNTGGGHYLRFFQAKTTDGSVIPGTYIGIQDYPGGGNFDYNDHMFLIRNVQAHVLTATEDSDDDGINDALQLDGDNDGTVDFFDGDTTPPIGPQNSVQSDGHAVARGG